MRISDWSSDVCSSDLIARDFAGGDRGAAFAGDQRRHAHAQLAGRRSVAKQHAPGLVEHVDEARRDIASARIDLLLSRAVDHRSEEHTSELQSLMRISYAVFCLKKKITTIHNRT